VDVSEIFTSIQGESSFAGSTCFFVRLSGCNLRCRYCDTTSAYSRGEKTAVEQIRARWSASSAGIAEITGGEPLLQPGFGALARALRDASPRPVLVETNGSLDISTVPDGVVAIMDVKCPGSGEGGSADVDNMARLRPADEVKFVLVDRADYDWACDFVLKHDLAARCRYVWFSPSYGTLEPRRLAEWLMDGNLPVRMQVQMHKAAGIR